MEDRSGAASAAKRQDYVPKDHLSRFIVALVREGLDLKEITASYASALGQPPFDPWMMTALLLQAYASGFYSSRRIAKACIERADFMMIVALDPPDFRTISDFRKRHSVALAGLFVLKLAEAAWLVKLVACIFRPLTRREENRNWSRRNFSYRNARRHGDARIRLSEGCLRRASPTGPSPSQINPPLIGID